MSVIVEDGIPLRVAKYIVTEEFVVCYYYSDFLGEGPYFSEKSITFEDKQKALNELADYLSHKDREGAVIQRITSITTNPESNLIRQIVSSDIIVERRKSSKKSLNNVS
jgi:hypothetical protein